MPLTTTLYSDGSADSGVPSDQLIIYDEAIRNWLLNDFDIIRAKPLQYTTSSPHHGYSEAVTGIEPTQGRYLLPRVAVTRGDHELDINRFNPSTIRRLGRTTSTQSYSLRQGQFPVPIIIPYQLDFWTEFVREMNLFEQKLLFQMAYGYKYLSISVDSVWGTKTFPLFLEGSLVDTSELEVGDQPREIRRTATLRAEAWLFDQSFNEVGVVKRIYINHRDLDTNEDFGTVSPNRHQDLYTADGIATNFTGSSLIHVPVLPDTFLLSGNFGGTEAVVEDDGAGNLFGSYVSSGTIDYNTGAVSVTYSTPPDSGTLLATWLTDLS